MIGKNRVTFDSSAGADDVEIMSGAVPYRDFLRRVHQELSPRFYVEIGVRQGRSLALAGCKAVGIDPCPEIAVPLPAETLIYRETSDDFFNRDGGSTFLGRVDLAFIDGMHLIEYALRDFMNIERRAHAASVVVFDDIFPNHPVQAERRRQSRVWTGDIWKIISCLRTHRPELLLLPIDTYPTGLLLVAGLDPGNQQLGREYGHIVEELTKEPRQPVPARILERRGAVAPDDPRVADILGMLRKTRESCEGNLTPGEGLLTRHAVFNT